MRIVRYLGPGGATYVGVVEGDLILPVGRGSGDATQGGVIALAMDGGHGVPDPIAEPVPYAGAHLLAPVPRPPSIRDFYAFEQHVATANRARERDVPPAWYEVPVFYFTNPAVVVDPGAEVRRPRASQALDYELEVAAVIGRDCADVAAGEARDVIAGFTIMNDWSARDLQGVEMPVGLGPAKGKDFATSLGPMLVTVDELEGEWPRPSATMVARVNGDEWSRGELADIHWGWDQIIEHASRDTRLRAGDVIGSGTVGTGCILELMLTAGPERYPWLQAGDVVELEVSGLGTLTNTVT